MSSMSVSLNFIPVPGRARRANRSYVWRYAKQTDETRVECKFCGKVFDIGKARGSLYGLKYHLRATHDVDE